MLSEEAVATERDRQLRLAADYRVLRDDDTQPIKEARRYWAGMHEYAAQVLSDLLRPAIPTYTVHDDHMHSPADGADGRDAHAS